MNLPKNTEIMFSQCLRVIDDYIAKAKETDIKELYIPFANAVAEVIEARFDRAKWYFTSLDNGKTIKFVDILDVNGLVDYWKGVADKHAIAPENVFSSVVFDLFVRVDDGSAEAPHEYIGIPMLISPGETQEFHAAWSIYYNGVMGRRLSQTKNYMLISSDGQEISVQQDLSYSDAYENMKCEMNAMIISPDDAFEISDMEASVNGENQCVWKIVRMGEHK